MSPYNPDEEPYDPDDDYGETAAATTTGTAAAAATTTGNESPGMAQIVSSDTGIVNNLIHCNILVNIFNLTRGRGRMSIYVCVFVCACVFNNVFLVFFNKKSYIKNVYALILFELC